MITAIPNVFPGSMPHGAGSTRDAGIPPALHWTCQALRAPFDLMRVQHAQAIRAGLMKSSMLESREFERGVHALESLCLGPLARRV